MSPIEILLIDDSETDAELIRMFARTAKVANPIHHVLSGEEGLAYLEATDRSLPGLVLLDINMPVMDGHQVLQAIRQHSDTDIATLPVVFLTTSDDPNDVALAYRRNVSSYVVKPIDMAGYVKILQALSQYWFEIVKTPHTRAD